MLNSSRLILAALILFFACPQSATAKDRTHGLSEERLDRISSVMTGYVEAGRLPGAVYSIQRNGVRTETGTTGPYRADSLFRIYSMTKPITVVAALMLFEEGRFLLSDPLERYLPEYADMMVWEAGADGKGKLRPAAGPITIEQLMTHTAGLSYADDAPGVPSLYAASDHWQASSLEEFSHRVSRLPLAFDPGERWHYSVANDVMGRLIEVVSGIPFDEYLRQRVLVPLGMNDTFFHVSDEKLDRFTAMYRKEGEGMVLVEEPQASPYRNPEVVPYGGSGLISTAHDYLRFCQMLLNGGELDGKRLLSRKTVDLMMMNHLGGPDETPVLNEAWLASTENRTGNLQLGFGFAYGGYVITDVAANSVPGSVGTYAWGGNSSSYFFIDPAEQMAAVFLTQLSPSSSYPLRAQFRALVYQALTEE